MPNRYCPSSPGTSSVSNRQTANTRIKTVIATRNGTRFRRVAALNTNENPMLRAASRAVAIHGCTCITEATNCSDTAYALPGTAKSNRPSVTVRMVMGRSMSSLRTSHCTTLATPRHQAAPKASRPTARNSKLLRYGIR